MWSGRRFGGQPGGAYGCGSGPHAWHLPSVLSWPPASQPLMGPQACHRQTLSRSCWGPAPPLAPPSEDQVQSLSKNFKYFDLRFVSNLSRWKPSRNSKWNVWNQIGLEFLNWKLYKASFTAVFKPDTLCQWVAALLKSFEAMKCEHCYSKHHCLSELLLTLDAKIPWHVRHVVSDS